jgi:hypothetical protein
MVRDRIQDRWKKQWESEWTAQPTKRLVEWPNKKVLRLYECLSKPRPFIMIQMRSMRIALRHFLYKINEVESNKCPCGEGSQTPRHVLLQCQTYGVLRKRLFDQLHNTGMRELPIMILLYQARWQPATLLNLRTKPVFLPSFNTLSKKSPMMNPETMRSWSRVPKTLGTHQRLPTPSRVERTSISYSNTRCLTWH